MSYTLEQLAADCHQALAADPGPAGREAMRPHLERALADADFVEDHLGEHNRTPPPMLHADSEFGVCIFDHVYTDAKDGEPHDHAGTCANYGQASSPTQMTDWRNMHGPQGGVHGVR